MSHNPDEDYPNNIDEQLLTAVKDQVRNQHDLEDARVKLEDIASAASIDKQSQQSQTSDQESAQQQISDVKHEAHQLAQQQLQQHQQHQQQHQQHQQHQHQHAQHHSLQQHLHQAQHQHHFHDSEIESEFNIQIPEPIIDSKSKIYPVTENTITAEGNLITRPFPEQEFSSRDELNEFIQEFARDNGFGVVIAHSNKKAIYYTCELGGRYRHKKAKKDESEPDLSPQNGTDLGNGYILEQGTKTKKLRCPFSMTASFRKSSPKWYLRTTCNEHNHPQLDPLSNHPMLRKRSDELNLLILDLYKVGTKPSHIEKKIKEQYPGVLIKREDIYNEIRGYKRKLKKQHRFISGVGNPSRHSTLRRNQNYQPVLDGHNSGDVGVDGVDENHHEITDRAIEYEIERQRQEAELQRQLSQHQHSGSHHIDEQQLQHYQQQLQEHGIDDSDTNDSTAAAAIAAVAASTQNNSHNASELSMDNIDSRLVGE